jgi:hypothetical protein
MQLFTLFYKRTVTPITCCTVAFSVYTRGYSDGIQTYFGKLDTGIRQYLIGNIESALLGYIIGVTYPIGIPACIGYVYFTET